MGLIKGGFLRLSQTFLYVLAFLCSALIIGIYSYFLAVLADRDVSIPTYAKAVEGIAGVATLFTLFAVVLTCCLGGITFFGLLAVLLNILVMGGFIAIAVLTRSAVHSCTANNIRTGPLGRAADSSFNSNVTYAVSPRTACRLNKAVFIVSIIGAFLFLVCALVQLLIVRSHKKEKKKYGPSPANDYTTGYGEQGKKKFWQRKTQSQTDGNNGARAIDLVQPVPAGTLGHAGPDMRPSYETATTVGNGGVYDKDATAVPATGVIYGHETATNPHTQHHHY
ncbi:uncharacterized protein RCC_01906 [Ramularia collo-cygni]|uniref:MARVEL domain-containing protein n=1 Tax=Ramularia collo-cygni TaxID=112498 RepID=A0A2D3UY28_9PEZI|nr:uncharacterized protein RCC_01906 [Ramularia collo-cygni]CZT16066.1 uncharacterized protein RCC_01906 [Ramularia collo-cygni]